MSLIRNLLKRAMPQGRPETEANMADESTAASSGGTASAAASSGNADLSKLVSAAVALAIAPLAEQLGALGKAHGDLAANQKVLADTLASSKPVGADEIAKTVEAALEKRGQAQASGDRRKAFVAEQLKGIPDSYHAHLGDDETKWGEKAVEIRAKLKADLTAMGVKLPEVSGEPGPGAGATAKAPAVTTDLSKLTADQKIALGLKARPVPGTVAPADTGKAA